MATHDPHQFTNPAHARAFALAGNATLTLVSLKTGARFTYRIRKGKKRPDDPHFVSVRDGEGFSYLGCVFKDGTFKVTRRSRYDSGQPCARAFRFFKEALDAGAFHPQLEVWHEGRCGKCGRQLTVPESIATGLGPECSAVAGVARVKLERPKKAKKASTRRRAPAGETDKERAERIMDEDEVIIKAQNIEREMQRMEATADDIQTYRENVNKWLARSSMEQ
jgi:hypothetical protein